MKILTLWIGVIISSCSIFTPDQNQVFYGDNANRELESPFAEAVRVITGGPINEKKTGATDGIKACHEAQRQLWGQSYASFEDYPLSTKEKLCGQGNADYKDNPEYCRVVAQFYEEKGFPRCAVRWYSIGCSYRDRASCESLDKVQRSIASEFEKNNINNNSELEYVRDKYQGIVEEKK